MMVVFFIGIGMASILAGLSDGPVSLLVLLAGIGLFAAVYHPVGIPWLIRNAQHRTGLVLATNGIFGSLGVALAAVVAGGLIDLWGWRVAFMVPGVISIVTGLVMLALMRAGRVADRPLAEAGAGAPSRADRQRVYLILLFTMFASGLVYHSAQTVMPKLFAERLVELVGGSTLGIGLFVGAVYMVSGVAQLLGGILADRLPLKTVYLGAWAPQILLFWFVAGAGGVPLLLAMSMTGALVAGSLPAENMLLARHAPARHHGLAFGMKFVLGFGAAPVAIQLVAWLQAATGGFFWLFAALAMVALAVSAFALFLPGRRAPTPMMAAGE
jgi:MFS family permease